MAQFLGSLHIWLWSAALFAAAIVVGLVAHSILYLVARRVTARGEKGLENSVVRNSKGPTRLIFPVLAVLAVLPVLPLPTYVTGPIRHFVGLALIASLAWLTVAFIATVEDLLAVHYRIDVRDNLAARRLRTQVRVIRRIVVVLVVIVALSIMLMTFPSIRQVGTSLLASAGLAGLVVGLAAYDDWATANRTRGRQRTGRVIRKLRL